MENEQLAKLIDAILRNNYNAALESLLQGTDPNAFEDRARIRPLHFTVVQHSKELAQLLITFGADPTAENAEGETPIDLAKEVNDSDLLRLFTSVVKRPATATVH